MLPRICPILPCRKRLVRIVQGLTGKLAGINPRDTISEGVARVTINNITFSPIKTHIGFRLDLL